MRSRKCQLCIIRVKKHKSAASVWGVRATTTEIDCPTATGDPTTNKAFGYSASHAAAERVRERLQQIEAVSPGIRYRKNQAVALEYMITGSRKQ